MELSSEFCTSPQSKGFRGVFCVHIVVYRALLDGVIVVLQRVAGVYPSLTVCVQISAIMTVTFDMVSHMPLSHPSALKFEFALHPFAY